MREFLSLLIMPIPVSFLLILSAFVFMKLSWEKTGKVLLWIIGIWILVITTPPIPRLLVKSLEDQYTQIPNSVVTDLTDSCDIIVLGRSHSDDKNLSPNNQLSNIALGRLIEGIRIHKMITASRLILSGYRGQSELPQALVLYRTALLLGVDSGAMSMLPMPTNTWMEAKEYINRFGRNRNLILVTCAVDMPRAIMLFRKAGVNPIPAPTNFLYKHGTHKYRWRWIPCSDNIRNLEEVIHEYAGLVWSWLGGE